MPTKSDQPPNRLLTVAQVASYLNRSRWSCYQWIAAGTIPSVEIGRSRMVYQHDLDRAIRERGIAPMSKEQRTGSPEAGAEERRGAC